MCLAFKRFFHLWPQLVDSAPARRNEAGVVLFPCFSYYAFTCLPEIDRILLEIRKDFPRRHQTDVAAQSYPLPALCCEISR